MTDSVVGPQLTITFLSSKELDIKSEMKITFTDYLDDENS